ncbi:MAG: Crp/Fnr family transcriptional regulator, partial [Selenomonadaceae bacterium]|nr:Crp/Fnr family transcriptional regulator [Selenomonadaceae bacterium]
DVLSRLRLLQGIGSGFIQEFMGKSHLETRFEGDRISGAIMEENLILIVAGKLARSIEAGDGWYNTLDILKEGDWANETILLPDKKAHFSVEVLTEEAEILLYPLSKMNDLMVKYPQIGKNMVQHLARQMEKYQRLWVQS